MFKRIVGLIVVALLCLSVVSCGKKDEENKVELGDASKSEIASESEDVQDISNSTQQQEGKSNETTQEEKTDGQVGEETSKEDNQKEKADEEPKEINPELTKTKTGKVETETFLGNYYMELELIFDENTDDEAVMKCCYAVEDLNSYFRIKNDIMDFSMIIKPEVRYTVDNNSKQYLEGLHDFLLSFSEVIKRLRSESFTAKPQVILLRLELLKSTERIILTKCLRKMRIPHHSMHLTRTMSLSTS